MLFLENIHHLIGASATLSSHSHLHGPLEKKIYVCIEYKAPIGLESLRM